MERYQVFFLQYNNKKFPGVNTYVALLILPNLEVERTFANNFRQAFASAREFTLLQFFWQIVNAPRFAYRHHGFHLKSFRDIQFRFGVRVTESLHGMNHVTTERALKRQVFPGSAAVERVCDGWLAVVIEALLGNE